MDRPPLFLSSSSEFLRLIICCVTKVLFLFVPSVVFPFMAGEMSWENKGFAQKCIKVSGLWLMPRKKSSTWFNSRAGSSSCI